MKPEAILDRLSKAVLALDFKGTPSLAREALQAGIPAASVIADGLSRGMREVGQKFKCGEMFMPEVLVACDAYYAGLAEVRPHLEPDGLTGKRGTIVMGTIYGDIHSVGKDVAAPVFEAAGYKVIDLGIDVPARKFVEAIRTHRPQIVGLGTYMTATFMHTRDVVEELRKAGVRDEVRIICGGPAVDAARARSLGADDASDDAWEAIRKMDRMVDEMGAGQGGKR